MNILVTGGTGLVGLHLIPVLLEQGHSVRILVRDRVKAIELLGNSCDIKIGDVTNKVSLIGCCDGIDFVYHMIAKVGNELPSDANFKEFRKVNVEGVQNIVEVARKANVKRFIYISSIAAMGIVNEPLINEKSICSPYLPYQVSKYEGEQVVLDAYKKYGFPGINIRPTKIYGPGEREFTYLLLAKLCIKGFFPKIGNKMNFTSNVYISDLIQGLVQLVKTGNSGETYILTSNDSIGLCDSVRVIAKVLKKNVRFIYIPFWFMDVAANISERLFIMLGKKPIVTRRNIEATVADRVYDISKAKEELGYNPIVPMAEGIANTIRYYMEKKLI